MLLRARSQVQGLFGCASAPPVSWCVGGKQGGETLGGAGFNPWPWHVLSVARRGGSRAWALHYVFGLLPSMARLSLPWCACTAAPHWGVLTAAFDRRSQRVDRLTLPACWCGRSIATWVRGIPPGGYLDRTPPQRRQGQGSVDVGSVQGPGGPRGTHLVPPGRHPRGSSCCGKLPLSNRVTIGCPPCWVHGC